MSDVVKAIDTGLVIGTGERHFTFLLVRPDSENIVHLWNESYKNEDDPVIGFLRDAFEKAYRAGFQDGLRDPCDR